MRFFYALLSFSLLTTQTPASAATIKFSESRDKNRILHNDPEVQNFLSSRIEESYDFLIDGILEQHLVLDDVIYILGVADAYEEMMDFCLSGVYETPVWQRTDN